MNSTLTILVNLINSITRQLKIAIKEQAPKKVLENDLRGKIFAIEGVLRLYIKNPNFLTKHENTLLLDVLNEVKTIEDAIGKYSMMYEIDKYIKDYKLEIDTKNFLLNADSEMKALISDNIVLKFNSFEETFFTINFPKKNKKFLKKSLKSELKRIDKKINTKLKPLIEVNQYSFHELEEGLHEFRRAIRWPSIYIQAYKLYFDLKKTKKPSKKEKTLIKANKNNPFTQFMKDKDAIKLDQISFLKLSNAINIVGELKTEGEMRHFVKEYFDLTLPIHKHIEELSQEVLRNFNRDKVLKNLLK